MSDGSAEDVRARLQNELRALLIDTIQKDSGASTALVNAIVEKLRPELQQQIAVTLDEEQLRRLGESINSRSVKTGNADDGGFWQQARQVALMVLALGLAALFVGTMLSLSALRPAGTASDSQQQQEGEGVPENAATTTGSAGRDDPWRRIVGEIAVTRAAFFRANAELICGASKSVENCQSFESARNAWMTLPNERLEDLQRVQEAIATAGGCQPLQPQPGQVPAISNYVTAIGNCVTRTQPGTDS